MMAQQDSVAVNVMLDGLLTTLKRGAFFERRKAAEDLARLPETSEQVVTVLMQVAQSDRDPAVRQAAIRALEASVHSQYVSSRSGLVRALADIKRQHHAQESAAAQPVDDSGWKSGLRFLNDIRLLVVGIISLFVMTSGAPLTFQLLCVVGVFIIGLAFIVQKYIDA